MGLGGLAIIFGALILGALVLIGLGVCAHRINRSEIDPLSFFIGAVVAGVGLACYVGWLVPDRWSPILVVYGGTLICLSVAMRQPASREVVAGLIRVTILAGFVTASLGVFGAHPWRMYLLGLTLMSYVFAVETSMAALLIGGFYVVEAVAGLQRLLPLRHPDVTLLDGATLVLFGAAIRSSRPSAVKFVSGGLIAVALIANQVATGGSGQAVGPTGAAVWLALAAISEARERPSARTQPAV